MAAIGRPHFVTPDMVKPGAVVIDVGINRIPDATKKSRHTATGDVDAERVVRCRRPHYARSGGVGHDHRHAPKKHLGRGSAVLISPA